MAKTGEIVSDEEMLTDFKVALHTALKDGRLGATALVTGLKAIRDLIPPAPPPEPVDTARFSVLEQIASLPKAEGKRLLKQEIARLTADLAAHEVAYDELKG